MKFHKNKFLTTVSAAALALAVGACGSSSDDNEGMSMLQTDLDAATAKAAALQEDLDEANAALMALETLIGDEMNPDPASVRGMLAQANLDLEQARTDLQMARTTQPMRMEIDRLTKAVTDAEGERNEAIRRIGRAANACIAEEKLQKDQFSRKGALETGLPERNSDKADQWQSGGSPAVAVMGIDQDDSAMICVAGDCNARCRRQ